MAIGYQHLIDALGLTAAPLRRVAQVRGVTSVQREEHAIHVPASVAPISADPVEHLLFALKHEGINLGVLVDSLRAIEAADVHRAIAATPNGIYARQLGFLFESATGQSLADLPPAGGAAVDLFDIDRYITGRRQRNAKWRVDFNGLGTMNYCATVERTDAVRAGISSRLPQRVTDFAATLTEELRDRALTWAYLSETRDSFAIEREEPGPRREAMFVNLLKQAHQRAALSEQYLTTLQQATVADRYAIETGFRQSQNWLQKGRAVTYVPPPPEVARELMGDLMSFGNALTNQVDPIVAATVLSFGFVYLHPFMDGNGRLSRFLFHHALCKTNALPDDVLLPVSVAMKKHEREYDRTLRLYSEPIRACWTLRFVDEGDLDLTYSGPASYSMYRYWDATAAVEFCYSMAEDALDVELRNETEFLTRFDHVYEALRHKDVAQNHLSMLIVNALEHDGNVSQRKRDRYLQLGVNPQIFDDIEIVAKSLLQGGAGSCRADAQQVDPAP